MSFDFKPSAGSKAELYRDLLSAIDAVTAGERDGIANMANAAALLFDWLPDVNWAGFYRLVEDELVLGPFQGKAACIRIELGKGVCGTAAATRETQLVDRRPRLSRPHRLRCGVGERDRRAAGGGRTADRRARHRFADRGAVRRG